MPYLRFARDARGYESTSVLHTFRRSGRNRSRILYWFRTPPNVKVGRAPLDELAIREIEKHHPDLEFDWTKILETQQPASPEPAQPRRSDRRSRRSGRQMNGGRAERPRTAQRSSTVASVGRPAESAVAIELAVEDVTARPMETELPGPPGMDAAEVMPLGATDANLSAGDAAEPDVAAEGEAVPSADDWESEEPLQGASQISAVEALVGAEGLARLRARHAEIQARITERGGDPAALIELRRRAEILDPDTWVTKEEARLALEHYETRLEEFRRLLGPRRRRSRRGGRRRRGRQNGAPAPPTAPAEGAVAGAEGSGKDPD